MLADWHAPPNMDAMMLHVLLHQGQSLAFQGTVCRI